MKILITGAGGFLGRHLAESLLKDGHQVTNFSRGSYPELEEHGVISIKGDLNNYQEVEKALENQEAVFHVASRVGMWGKWEDFYRTNVNGTENIIKACQKNNIKKLIYTSTPSVVYGKNGLHGVDETQPYPTEYLSYYAKSKALAEKSVLQANGVAGLLTVSLRPHLIFGPRDQNLVPRLVAAAKKGKLKIVGDGQNRVDVVYVDNAVSAHKAALEKLVQASPICGQAYFIGQGPVKLWDFVDQLLSAHKLKPLKKRIGLKNAYRIGAAMETGLRLFNKYDIEPPMTRFVALQLGTNHYFNHEKAQRDLDFHPSISLEEGVKRLKNSVS